MSVVLQAVEHPGHSSRGLVASGGSGVESREFQKLIGEDVGKSHVTTIIEVPNKALPHKDR